MVQIQLKVKFRCYFLHEIQSDLSSVHAFHSSILEENLRFFIQDLVTVWIINGYPIQSINGYIEVASSVWVTKSNFSQESGNKIVI